MLWGKIFRRTVFIMACFINLITSVTHAEIKIYEGIGEYYMSDFETPNIAQQRAKQRAEQNACEQAGVYVRSYSLTRNFELKEDIIETMTNGILKIIDVQYHRENFDNNTTLIRARIRAQIDDVDILRWLEKDEKEKAILVTQMEALRKVNEEQSLKIAELKRRLASSPQNKERNLQAFENEDKIFLSNRKIKEAWKFYEAGDYNNAIKFLDEAIQLNPDNALAYYGRGTVYGEDLKKYGLAIQDYDKAIQLNPIFVEAYAFRSIAYAASGKFKQAIIDADKAIQLNPNSVEAYIARSIAYGTSGKFKQAIIEVDKAIQINPNSAEAYTFRSFFHRALNNFNQAIADATKAIKLNPNLGGAYSIRSECYKELGYKKLANDDAVKASSLGCLTIFYL